MARKRLDPEDLRSETIPATVKPGEMAKIRHVADTLGMTISSAGRWLLLRGLDTCHDVIIFPQQEEKQ